MNEFVGHLGSYLTSSPLLAFAAVFLGGILTSFEPCIYTMLPITVSFIGSQAGGSRFKGFFLSFVYVMGMALMYSALGAIAALTGSLFGEISQKPAVNLIMGNVCIILGLSMFDLFSIRMPSFIANLQSKKVGSGYVAIFFLGIFSGLVVGPCTAAVLGVTLAYVASKQNMLFGISLLFTYSLGMGLIILAIGTFAGILMSLPKAGPWMERVRRFMGAVLIGIGEYFIFIAGQKSI
ncbi:MAG: cytochrome c biogenesis protein CcdA [Candidatus Eremiobacteraeota bacterium]|nr:cytochrome c biogenesis protein CcdA [Candidatus Eremiobacteraeota bacterium]